MFVKNLHITFAILLIAIITMSKTSAFGQETDGWKTTYSTMDSAKLSADSIGGGALNSHWYIRTRVTGHSGDTVVWKHDGFNAPFNNKILKIHHRSYSADLVFFTVTLSNDNKTIYYYDCFSLAGNGQWEEDGMAQGGWTDTMSNIKSISIIMFFHPSFPDAGTKQVDFDCFITKNDGNQFETFYDGPETGNLSGNVFMDSNNNAIHDTSEIPSPDIKIYLKGITIDSTTSDSLGNYMFSNVPRGTYQVYVKRQNGWIQTVPETDTTWITIGDTLHQTMEFGLYVTPEIAYRYSKRWNIVSVPKNVTDASVGTLFPSAVSQAFGYSGAGYYNAETLQSGLGYWLKFKNTQYVVIDGDSSTIVKIHVNNGWNMIGSLSGQIATNQITSDPPGIVTSTFYGYDNGYKAVDTLYPGQGYWVKSNDTGEFVLSLYGINPGTQIRIVSSNELPPPPPQSSNDEENIPQQTKLLQNYPNPFNPSTTINFEVKHTQYVTLKIYNTLGEGIAELVNGIFESGSYSIKFDASHFSSGMYFYRLQTADGTFTKKMLLMK